MDDATRMRDGGQSWTDIAETLGISVREAKSRVQEDKKARREGLARTAEAENRNGLRDLCAECDPKCNTQSMRRDHEGFTGGCKGCTCSEYVYIKRQLLPWYRLPKTEDPHYIDPETRLHDGVAIQALQLGVPVKVRRPPTDEQLERRGSNWFNQRGATVPQPRLETMVRRARKKLKKGKKLKRHYDAPTKNQWL